MKENAVDLLEIDGAGTDDFDEGAEAQIAGALRRDSRCRMAVSLNLRSSRASSEKWGAV